MLRKALKTLVLGVVTAAAVILALLPRAGLVDNLLTVSLLAAIAALVGGRPVHIAALGTRITATHPFELCAMAAFGPLSGAMVSLAAVAGATAGEKRRPQAIRLAFNLGAMVLANFLLSPEAQAKKQDPRGWGDATVLDVSALEPEDRIAEGTAENDIGPVRALLD